MSSIIYRCVVFLFLLGGGLMLPPVLSTADSYLLWTKTTPANQTPVITSTPPIMTSPAYHYDVEATDPDGNILTFSLSNAPTGMTIDASSGVIAWTAVVTQIGDHAPMVTVSDGQGGTASQTIPLTVQSEWFPLIVPFLAGVNLTARATEDDATVLPVGVGTNMTGVTEILLPDVPALFAFSDDTTFHFEYQSSTAIFVPEPTVVQMAIVDTATGGDAFADIHADDLTGLTWQAPAAHTVAATQTIVVQRLDGQYLKLGQVTVDLTAGSVTLFFGDVTP